MTGQVQPYIDLKTLAIVMPKPGVLTGEEWRRLVWPPCPKCGKTIRVDRIDVSTYERMDACIPGPWRCPNECDPRTVTA